MNKLSGPVNIFLLTSLEELLLGGNKFNQSLPSSLFWLVRLSKLVLSGIQTLNNVVLNITFFCLEHLDLFENEFQGSIHSNLQRLVS